MRPLTIHSADWEDGGWKVVLTDGFHTWIGRSWLLSWAFAAAFTRYLFDPNRWT